MLDARSAEVRERINAEIAAFNKEDEREILEWMEAVADLDGWTGQE